VEALGATCVRCGATEHIQYDHVDATTKVFKLSRAHHYSAAALELEIAKCQALCLPCHIQKSIECGDLAPRIQLG